MSLSSLNDFAVDAKTINSTVGTPAPNDGFSLAGEFNSSPLDYIAVDGQGTYIATFIPFVLSSSSIIKFTELTYIPVNGQVIKFVENVVLNTSISGEVITFTQEEFVSIPFPTIKFTQIIENAAVSTFFSNHGWDINIVINGVLLDNSVIASNVVITKESNMSTLCEFKVIPTNAMSFLTLADSAPMYINYRDSTGWHRVFTGYIDEPVVTLIPVFWIVLRCSNRREDRIRTELAPLLPLIGNYCLEVQGAISAGTTNSVSQELGYRLQTTTQDVDFDSYNNPSINSWYAKVTPDYTLGDSTVFYREPNIVWQSRTAIVNSIDIAVDYNYTRLYHYQRPFAWSLHDSDSLSYTRGSFGINNGAGYIAGITFPTVDMVQTAITGANWKDEGNTFSYEDHYPENVGSLNLLNDTYTYVNVNNLNPAFAPSRVIKIIPPASEGVKKIISAHWEASAHFSQNVTERYELNVHSTQSINQYVIITKTASYSLTAPFDTTLWDSHINVTPAPSNAIFSNSSYYIDKNDVPIPNSLPQILYTTGVATVNPALRYPNSLGEFNNLITTALNKAKTEIVGSHRGTSVELQIPIIPTLELSHTIDVDATRIQCQGKVKKIVQTIFTIDRQANMTEVTIALMKATGSATTDATSVPARPIDNPFEAATASGYRVNNSGGYPIGASDIAVDSGTGTLYDGNTITFAGDPTIYTVTATLNPLTLIVSISPVLVHTLADDALMTLGANIGGPTFSDPINLQTHMGVDPTLAPYYLSTTGQITPASNNGVIVHPATYDQFGNLLTPYSTSYGSVTGTPTGVQAWTGYLGNAVPYNIVNGFVVSNGVFSSLKEQFIVGTPASPPGLIGTRILTTVQTYQQALVADEFQVTT